MNTISLNNLWNYLQGLSLSASLLSHFKTEEEVRELNDLVCKYYSQKIDEEMDRLWDEGKWSHEKIEETLKEHLRTPYQN